jgi:hypothetical protein
MPGKIFGRNRSLIYRWIRKAGLRTAEPTVDSEITQIEFDEMWHFIESKKETLASRSKDRLKKQGNGGFDHPFVVFAHQTGSFCSLAESLHISIRKRSFFRTSMWLRVCAIWSRKALPRAFPGFHCPNFCAFLSAVWSALPVCWKVRSPGENGIPVGIPCEIVQVIARRSCGLDDERSGNVAHAKPGKRGILPRREL